MAARLNLFFVLLLTFTITYSQDLNCGTVPNAKDIKALRSLIVKSGSNSRNQDGDAIRIAISAHIVRDSNGEGGLTENELAEAIVDVNEIYTLTNMEFFLFGDINYIDNDQYFNFNSEDESSLTSVHDVSNTINVYFFNSARSGENSVCGYAYFPSSGIDHLIMVNSCTTNGSTFPHELGHYFALYHTHGKTNTGTTDELVNGSNCESAGDDICDTTADPNLSGKVNGECEYIGDETDENGDLFVPNPNNLMSYSQKHCRFEFSQGQADRISAAYQEYKTYLIDKTYAADFEVERREVCVGESLTFSDKSVGAVSYSWVFEGGTPSTSTEKNPVITYETEGIYGVSLTITEEGDEEDVIEALEYISVKSNVISTITERDGSFEETNLEESIINNDDGITFQTTTNAFTEGSTSVFIDFISYSNVGAIDYLVLPAINSENIKTFDLTFDFAYAPYNASYYDGLAIVYRDPCGAWNTVWEKSGTDLQTAEAQITEFIPTESQWKIRELVTINIPEDQEVVEFAFKAINGYGNQLYIDNYTIEEAGATFEISEVIVTNTSCPDTDDGSVEVNVTGDDIFEYSTDGNSYSSSNLMGNLEVGSYELFVKSESGTVKSVIAEVSFQNDYPASQMIVYENGELTIDVEENQTVQWFLNGTLLAGEESSTLSNPKSGEYSVEISNGTCTTLLESFLVLDILKVADELRLYPNPASSVINLELSTDLQKGIRKISILDLSGKNIKTVDFSNSINIQFLDEGMYLLDLEMDEGSVQKRFVKR